MVDSMDALVGARVRERRVATGKTQMQLADQIGTTFQQVQKYEKGVNRISASRLQAIATALGTTPAFFFETPTPRHSLEVSGFIRSSECMSLTRAFLAIEDSKVREIALKLVVAISETKGGTGP